MLLSGVWPSAVSSAAAGRRWPPVFKLYCRLLRAATHRPVCERRYGQATAKPAGCLDWDLGLRTSDFGLDLRERRRHPERAARRLAAWTLLLHRRTYDLGEQRFGEFAHLGMSPDQARERATVAAHVDGTVLLHDFGQPTKFGKERRRLFHTRSQAGAGRQAAARAGVVRYAAARFAEHGVGR